MSKNISYSDEPIHAEMIRDFLPPAEAISRTQTDEANITTSPDCSDQEFD
jgi:hypothetical protein